VITFKAGFSTAVCAAIFSGGVISPAHAVIALPQLSDAQFYFGGTALSVPSLADITQVSGQGVQQYDDGNGGVATGHLNLTPAPNIDFNVDNSGATNNITAAAGIRYFYTILGLQPGAFAAGTLTASMSVSGTGNYRVAAIITGTDVPFSAFTPSSDVAACSAFNPLNCPGFDASFSNKVVNVNFSSSGELDLITAAKIKGIGTATAFIDPVIQLSDPNLKITFSQGVGNSFAAPVPEPDTYALMIAGLGVIGFMARRKAKC
jgi:hypothetical protein